MDPAPCNVRGGNDYKSTVFFDSSCPQQYWLNTQEPCFSSTLCTQVPCFFPNPSREDLKPFPVYSGMESTSFHQSKSNGSTCELLMVSMDQFDDPYSFSDLETTSLCDDTESRSYHPSKNNVQPTDGLVGIEQYDDPDPFLDPVLKYINDMLMNEDVEERLCMYQECSALQATVKPFYDILGENCPVCPPVVSLLPSLSCSSNLSQLPSSRKLIHRESFDEVLLSARVNGKDFSAIQKGVLQNGVHRSEQKNTKIVLPRGKKPGKQKEVVDLRTLLIHCAQAVAVCDNQGAQEILKQVRQHSSPLGDGTQRLAHYFSESLVARLSGTGGYLYTKLCCNRPSAAEILKAYHLYMVASPFIKVSHFLSNQTILDVAQNASCLHIVDFGILYGFQWPALIQELSGRPNGPPKLKITGIDFPQPGSNPAERIEETARRLADYASSFGVPFEYQAIAAKWEDVDLQKISLRNDELLIVNCIYRLRNLMDETVSVESPRDIVLSKIRRMNPRLFIQGVVNGAYNAPFFVTRYREALFHYSALFDMLEATVPRDHPERMVIEKEMWGREVLNIVACEGLERVERPEAYKQWQIRMQRSGFVQLSLNQEIVSTARERSKLFYHKDFVVDEDGKWMLLGWKGRITLGLSTWRPSR